MSIKSPNKNQVKKRRLGHIDDITNINKHVPFSMIPQEILDAFIDGFIPPAKFKLICIILTNSSEFHIKRNYLEARFSNKSLKTYIQELVKDGIIEIEEVPLCKGGYKNIYHVNNVDKWKKYPTRKSMKAMFAKEIEDSGNFDDPSLRSERQLDDPFLAPEPNHILCKRHQCKNQELNIDLECIERTENENKELMNDCLYNPSPDMDVHGEKQSVIKKSKLSKYHKEAKNIFDRLFKKKGRYVEYTTMNDLAFELCDKYGIETLRDIYRENYQRKNKLEFDAMFIRIECERVARYKVENGLRIDQSIRDKAL